MAFDYTTLELLRENHPAWRLLCAHHAPLIAAFLHRVFIVPNVRNLSQADLVEALEDELYILREQLGDEAFPATARSYLNDWAENDKGWLRKFYPAGTDEPHFDLTPATEKALAWLEGLTERAFVGTESRLLTLFELLRQMSEGSQTDPHVRIAELKRRRHEMDVEIARIQAGDIPILDDTALKDRFQQFLQLARELLTDFREVEDNFRTLDRQVRERIALWQGGKGTLLEEIMGERDAIADSDQGKSFQAFWDFLMSQPRQEELTLLLEQVLSLSPIQAMHPDSRLRRVHYDWLEAGEHTQRTVAQAVPVNCVGFSMTRLGWKTVASWTFYATSKTTHWRCVKSPCLVILCLWPKCLQGLNFPWERPLFRPPLKPLITSLALDEGDAVLDTTALYMQVVVDRSELRHNIHQALQGAKPDYSG